VPFRVPAGIKLIRVSSRTGMRSAAGEGGVILEAFKPGTAPPDNYSIVGVNDAEGRPLVATTPDGADRMTRPGTGGLW
jgi:penicillin-binding protein 1A